MFKDSQEGQTHFENDGCGIKEHNKDIVGPVCLCGKPVCKETLEKMEKEFMQFVAEECNQARADGEKTSRLTSLAMRTKDLFKLS